LAYPPCPASPAHREGNTERNSGIIGADVRTAGAGTTVRNRGRPFPNAPAVFDQAISALAYVRCGEVQGCAVTAGARLAAAPDIPAIDEAGAPGVYVSWSGLWVPKGTPKNIIHKLTSVAMDALGDPAVRRRLEDLGQVIPPREQQTAGGTGCHKAEIEKWWPIIKSGNIKVEAGR